MIRGGLRFSFYFYLVLAGTGLWAQSTSGGSLLALAKTLSSTNAAPLLPPAPSINAPSATEPPLYTYPAITPQSSLEAHSLTELLDYKTDTGSPRWPSPNPWFPTDLYQGTITRKQFEQKLATLYDPFGVFPAYLDINDQRVVIYPSTKKTGDPQFILQFAPPNEPRAPMRWFRTPEEMRAQTHPIDKPLNGLRVAIDPGHIGGPWAQMEERSTSYNHSAPVQEGDLNLITARLLKQQLIDLGATVFVVRDSTEPVTPYRPGDMLPIARQMLINHLHSATLQAMSPEKANLALGRKLTELAEFLFYRGAEIRDRGNRIRNNFVPDITVTLYIDATPGSGRGRLTSANANIFFVHGAYTKVEMADPDCQRRCIYKMVEGSSPIEFEVASDIASVFAQRTGLGPVKYGDSSTTRLVIPGNLAVVARNLAANRDYDGPVVCTEPYFMNNRTVYQRLLAGDYEGLRTFDGKKIPSIFREYADCVAQGLVKSYSGPTNLAGTTNAAPLHPK